MKCDARKTKPKGGKFHCSVLGEARGPAWIWQELPYKEKVKSPPDCDACLNHQWSLFGGKHFFNCWVMGKVEVSKEKKETLEKKLGRKK